MHTQATLPHQIDCAVASVGCAPHYRVLVRHTDQGWKYDCTCRSQQLAYRRMESLRHSGQEARIVYYCAVPAV